MRQIGREPIFIERGEGRELIDVEGNRYLDWVGSWGPLILGHAEPSVVAATIEAAKRGTSYGAATAAEVALAEEVAARVPSVEMVRMTSSGTEAAMGAVRLARAISGREVAVKFAGAYHGHSDGLLADAGSGLATLGVPGSPGVTAAQAAIFEPAAEQAGATVGEVLLALASLALQTNPTGEQSDFELESALWCFATGRYEPRVDTGWRIAGFPVQAEAEEVAR